MHEDVQVIDIESDTEDTDRRNKSNPTADIDEFWEKVPHKKGDNKGRRKLLTCVFVQGRTN
jgi:hypothetical protein